MHWSSSLFRACTIFVFKSVVFKSVVFKSVVFKSVVLTTSFQRSNTFTLSLSYWPPDIPELRRAAGTSVLKKTASSKKEGPERRRGQNGAVTARKPSVSPREKHNAIEGFYDR
ncbi:hypothetical protein OAG76_00165 [Rubripirellula sp.]|nr:hypothetical protein [Rubripirellula sp.]